MKFWCNQVLNAYHKVSHILSVNIVLITARNKIVFLKQKLRSRKKVFGTLISTYNIYWHGKVIGIVESASMNIFQIYVLHKMKLSWQKVEWQRNSIMKNSCIFLIQPRQVHEPEFLHQSWDSNVSAQKSHQRNYFKSPLQVRCTRSASP